MVIVMKCCSNCGTKMKFINLNDYVADKLYCPKCDTYVYIQDDQENMESSNIDLSDFEYGLACQVED